MKTETNIEDVRKPLIMARRMLFLRTVSRMAALAGLGVLLTEAVLVFLQARQHVPWFQVIHAAWPVMTGFLILGVIAGLVTGWLCHGKLAAVAKIGEARMPGLGLRVSASLEVPGLKYCPPVIRRALFRDTLLQMEKSRWKHHFKAPFKTSFWIILALMMFLAQGILMTVAGRAMHPKSVASEKQKQMAQAGTYKNELEKNIAADRSPSLKIIDPGQDQLATKIDAIELTAEGTAPAGIENLRLEVSVNGEEPKSFPLDVAAITSRQGRATGWLYLDEMELNDYDVLTCNVTGETRLPDETKVEVSSNPFFVQIRPFRADIDEEAGGTPNKPVDLLNLMIEEERDIIRTTWSLNAAAETQARTPEYKNALTGIAKAQSKLLNAAREQQAALTARLPEKAPAETLREYDKAQEEMEQALKQLDKGKLPEALPAEQKALASLVELRQLMRQAVAEQKESAESKPKDPQKKKAEKDNLVVLMTEQEKINTEQKSTAKEKPKDKLQAKPPEPSKKQEKNQQLADRQNALAVKTREAAEEKDFGEQTRELLRQAREAMEQNATALTPAPSPKQPATEQAQNKEPGRDTAGKQALPQPPESRPPKDEIPVGEMALNYLRQAAAIADAEKLVCQAVRLKKMLGTMADHQQDLQEKAKPPADQKKIAASLGGMKDQLLQMAKPPASKAKATLKTAAQVTAQAAKLFQQSKGRSATLDRPMATLVKAHQQSVGELKHLTRMHAKISAMKRQMGNLELRTKKDPEAARKLMRSKAGQEWKEAWSKGRSTLTKELVLETGRADAVRKFMSSADGLMANEKNQELKAVSALKISAGRVEAALLVRLKSISQRDLLKNMAKEEVPAGYRELVKLYFLRLSRQQGDISKQETKNGTGK